MIEGRNYIDLTKASGGGGGDTSDYTDLSNKPKVNGNTLVGNKTSSQLGLQDALVSGTNIKTINSTSLLGSGDITATEDVQINGTSIVSSGVANIPVANTSNTLGLVKVAGTQGMQVSSSGLISGLTKTAVQYADLDNSAFICKGTLNNIQNTFVRSVAPACTTITASDTTATITANSTYAHAVSSSGCVYTLTTPSDTTAYNGFILMLDTTNSASIAFSTDGTPATSISISGNPTIETGKSYTVVGQYNILTTAWNLWISEYKGA